MSLAKIVIETAPGVPSNADDDESAASKINAGLSKIDDHQQALGKVDQVLALSDDFAAAVSTVQASKVSAEESASVAVGAKQSISDELDQVQSLALQVSSDKELVESTKLGDEDYVISAAAKLLSKSNVVDVAISDDTWAEHAYKWGGPSQVLAYTDGYSVFLCDMTKPSLPSWREFTPSGLGSLIWAQGDIKITCIEFVGSMLLIGNRNVTSNYTYTGLRIADFAEDRGFVFGGEFGYKTPNPDIVSKSLNAASDADFFTLTDASTGYLPRGNFELLQGTVNDISAYISESAPYNPATGLPMPHIGVATDKGVNELIPSENGELLVLSWPASGPINVVQYVNDRLLAKREHEGRIYDLSKIGQGIELVESNVTYFSEGVELRTLTGGVFMANKMVASAEGVSILNENSSDPAKGMIAHITEGSSTPFMPGEVYCSVLCDSGEGVLTDAQIDDYSGKGNHIAIDGVLSFAKPAGSDIAVASGFGPGGGIKVLDGANLTANGRDFCLSAAAVLRENNSYVFDSRDTNGDNGGGPNYVIFKTDGSINFFGHTTAQNLIAKSSRVVPFTIVKRANGDSDLWVDAKKIISGVNISISENDKNTAMGIGRRYTGGDQVKELSQLTISASVPLDDQIRDLHRDMLNKLSKPSMLTAPVAALAHDVERNQDWIVTDDKKLHRLDGTCFVDTDDIDSSVGDITSLKVVDGEFAIGNSNGVFAMQSAKNLRETKVISAPKTDHKLLGEGDSIKTEFYLPYGWKPMRVEVDGIVKQKGKNKTWTCQFDGYRYFIRFKVAPGNFPISCLMKEVN